MGRILAVDYGTKRIGLAVSDPLKLIAGALDTVQSHQIWKYLEEYFRKEDVEEVVIGLPMRLNNSPSVIYNEVKKFIIAFKKKFPETDVHEYDERFTSVMAQNSIRYAGAGKSTRMKKELVDKVSATILLQSYMEYSERKLK